MIALASISMDCLVYIQVQFPNKNIAPKMINHKDLNSIITIIVSVSLPIIPFFLVFSFIWDFYFIKRIRYFIILYKDCLNKAKTDPFDNFSERTLHHRQEIIKYVFLLVLNLAEFQTMLIYGSSAGLANIPLFYKRMNSSGSDTIPICVSNFTKINIIDLELFFENPIFSFLIALGHIGLLMCLAIGICIAKYLDVTYHDINGKSLPYIRRFLILTILIGFLLVIFGSIPQLMIIEKSFEPLILSIYFFIWIRSNWKFHKTLKWRSTEFRVRSRSNWIVRRSVISSHQFAIIMTTLGVSFAFLVLGEFLLRYFFLVATLLFYGPCLFNYIYGVSFIPHLLNTPYQIHILHCSNQVIQTITSVSCALALILIWLEYFIATILFFGGIIVKKLKYRFGKVRTRFTPDLSDPLLITSQR